MKKMIVRLLAACLSAAMVLSMASCGGDKGTTSTGGTSTPASDTQSSTPASDTPSSAPSADESASADAEGGDIAQQLADYIASDDIRSEVESLNADAADMGMSNIDILSEGTTLVYVYTYTDDIAIDGMAEALGSAIEQEAETFENVASVLSTAFGGDVSVEVRYMAADGSMIYNHVFENP